LRCWMQAGQARSPSTGRHDRPNARALSDQRPTTGGVSNRHPRDGIFNPIRDPKRTNVGGVYFAAVPTIAATVARWNRKSNVFSIWHPGHHGNPFRKCGLTALRSANRRDTSVPMCFVADQPTSGSATTGIGTVETEMALTLRHLHFGWAFLMERWWQRLKHFIARRDRSGDSSFFNKQ